MKKFTYRDAILDGFEYLLTHHPEVFVIGQGLSNPWYVGDSMKDLDRKFGKERVIDTPISEDGTTGVAVGASLCGYRPVVVHSRMDFMLLAVNSIVNQAAKWSHMLGGQTHPALTIRGIVNRGGEQGAQHSQSLHSWFAHIPGLRVVMPATVEDARDLLIASVLCDDPVLYIDDRWCYEEEAELPPAGVSTLSEIKPRVLRWGTHITLVGSSYSTLLARQTADLLKVAGVSAEVIDLRVINPLDISLVVQSVRKTGRLAVIDGSWANCGLAGEVIASVTEQLSPSEWKMAPCRFTLPPSPTPSSSVLEKAYYPTAEQIAESLLAKGMGPRETYL